MSNKPASGRHRSAPPRLSATAAASDVRSARVGTTRSPRVSQRTCILTGGLPSQGRAGTARPDRPAVAGSLPRAPRRPRPGRRGPAPAAPSPQVARASEAARPPPPAAGPAEGSLDRSRPRCPSVGFPPHARSRGAGCGPEPSCAGVAAGRGEQAPPARVSAAPPTGFRSTPRAAHGWPAPEGAMAGFRCTRRAGSSRERSDGEKPSDALLSGAMSVRKAASLCP